MKICETCGKEFEPSKCHSHQVTCSKQCNILRQRKKIAEKLAARRIKIKHCEMCGEDFEVTKYNWKKTKWCSKCHIPAHRELQRKWQKLHPSPSRSRPNRINQWGGNWWKALERDKEICQICGEKGTQVHHIDFNHNRYCNETKKSNSNHSLDNLQVLCARCHLAIHHPTIRVNVAEKKITMSGLLFQVFPDYQIIINK